MSAPAASAAVKMFSKDSDGYREAVAALGSEPSADFQLFPFIQHWLVKTGKMNKRAAMMMTERDIQDKVNSVGGMDALPSPWFLCKIGRPVPKSVSDRLVALQQQKIAAAASLVEESEEDDDEEEKDDDTKLQVSTAAASSTAATPTNNKIALPKVLGYYDYHMAFMVLKFQLMPMFDYCDLSEAIVYLMRNPQYETLARGFLEYIYAKMEEKANPIHPAAPIPQAPSTFYDQEVASINGSRKKSSRSGHRRHRRYETPEDDEPTKVSSGKGGGQKEEEEIIRAVQSTEEVRKKKKKKAVAAAASLS